MILESTIAVCLWLVFCAGAFSVRELARIRRTRAFAAGALAYLQKMPGAGVVVKGEAVVVSLAEYKVRRLG